MTLTQRIKKLADMKKTNFAEIERTVGISNGQIRRWDTSSPKIENIQKVADYFGVSVDYLLGRTDDPNFLKTENENTPPEFFAIQRKSKKLNRSDQARLLKIMEATFDDIDSGEFEEDTGDDL
ncbi:helix-turn-helix domain-containing protein [Vagococcus salmoninarum]|uniref:helix-turn-helix domain-containing protein n=1 Tax=Vagococcus salmoninarum TaxID=2739 RepID=UPI00187E487A|nr:helix-turn-helix transcriptional regulator [Vagococcus salmoninarum]MBE9390041.1 helix-turn-helix transcriptional regulator [Vagococcus salmoninarum]